MRDISAFYKLTLDFRKLQRVEHMFEEPEVGGVEELKKTFLRLHASEILEAIDVKSSYSEILEAIDVQRIPVVDEQDLALHGVPLDLILQNEAAQ